MNIQQLEYIIAVDRFKNFTKAADHCNVTQATLSAMVKKLEQELDLVIFDRKSNPILTTDAAMVIIEDAKKVVQHSNQLKENAQRDNQEIEGKIRIGIIPTIANSLLPKIIRLILTTYPELHIEIVEITTDNILKQLREEAIDVGIMATEKEYDDIEQDVLYYEALMVYGQLAEDKKYLLPEEIQKYKIWLLEEGHCLREQFIKLCSLRKKEIMPDNFSFDASSFETLLSMVDAFGGLTLIPELYYQTLSEEKKKLVSFFESPIPVREVSMVYYRPYAKRKTIMALSRLISKQINADLLSNQYKKSELYIAKI